jgi:hypothetical protein
VQPGTAQIFVDGYYVGTANDLDAARRGVVLETGPHRIELAAPGYEGVGFDVRIAPNHPIVYRAALKSTVPPMPSSPQALSAPVTFYLIPGCYAGNVHPKEATLRPSCDISRMITVAP